MANCLRCGAPLEDGAGFCAACGTPVQKQIVCAACGNVTAADGKFCERCGQPLAIPAAPVPAPAPVETVAPVAVPVPAPVPAPAPVEAVAPVAASAPVAAPVAPVAQPEAMPVYDKKPKKKLPIMLIAIIAAAAVLVVALAAVLLTVLGGKTQPPILYIADGELHAVMQGKWDKPFEVTENMGEDYPMVKFSENGQYMFYLDDGALYYRDLTKDNTKVDGEKLDSDVDDWRFAVAPNGKRVLYTKNGKLYEHDLKERTSIQEDVEGFVLSADGKTVLYQTEDGDIYTKAVGSNKEAEKLASASEVQYFSDDLQTIVYTKDGQLYVKVGNKDKQKLDEGDEVSSAYGFGGKDFYFLNDTTMTVKASDYVDDDLKTSDAAMTEPVKPEWPTREWPDTDDYRDANGYVDWDAYYAASDEMQAAYDEAVEQYNEDYEAYEEARDAYWDKEDRDELRAELEETEVDLTNHQLYYFDGSKVTLVAENVADINTYANETAMLLYDKLGGADTSKVKLSEIEYVSDVTERLNYGEVDGDMYLAVGAKETTFEQDDAMLFSFDATDEKLYFIDAYNYEEGVGVLKVATIGEGGVSKIDTIDEEVDDYYLRDKGDVVYVKNVYEDTAEMYVNKKLLVSDVYIYSLQFVEGSEQFYCLTDYSESSQSGTLQLVTDKATKVADDVFAFQVYSEKCVAMLTDYNVEKERGTLEVYTGGKTVKVADDVTTLA